MIQEQYVDFEIARLLKSKGFPQDHDSFHSPVYNEEDYKCEYEVARMVCETKFIKAGTLSTYPAGVSGPICYAPTLAQTMKWLREIPELFIEVNYNYYVATGYKYSYVIKSCNSLDDKTGHTFRWVTQETFNTYEEAVRDAIKYCLTNDNIYNY